MNDKSSSSMQGSAFHLPIANRHLNGVRRSGDHLNSAFHCHSTQMPWIPMELESRSRSDLIGSQIRSIWLPKNCLCSINLFSSSSFLGSLFFASYLVALDSQWREIATLTGATRDSKRAKATRRNYNARSLAPSFLPLESRIKFKMVLYFLLHYLPLSFTWIFPLPLAASRLQMIRFRSTIIILGSQ